MADFTLSLIDTSPPTLFPVSLLDPFIGTIGPITPPAGSLEALLALQPNPAPSIAPDRTDQWRGAVYDIEGEYYGELPTLQIERFRWRAQPPWSADIIVSLDDPGLQLLRRRQTPPREVLLERRGRIMLVGPFVSRQSDSDSRLVRGTVFDPMWYFAGGRKNIGNPSRTNYLQNFQAEAGDLSHWHEAGAVVATNSTTRSYVDDRSFRLEGTGGNDFLYQDIGFTSGERGATLYLTAWMYTDVFTGPAPFGASLRLERIGATDDHAVGMTFDANRLHTPRDQWMRQSCFVKMPPNTTETIRAKLYAPDGVKYFDYITLVAKAGLHFGNDDWDQGRILLYLMHYFQGTGPLGHKAPEKPNLFVRMDIDQTSGVKRRKHYWFSDHKPAYNQGDGMAVIDNLVIVPRNGMDLRMIYARTPGPSPIVTRTLKARNRYPNTNAMTKDITDFVFTYRKYPNNPAMNASEGIVKWEYGNTIEGSVTDPCVLGGWGTDDFAATREEGGARDRDWLGGLSLERVETAPDGEPVDNLDDIARRRTRQLAHAIETLTLTLREPRDPITDQVTYPFIGNLDVGDHIFIRIDDGDLVWRVFGDPDAPLEAEIVDLQMDGDENLFCVVNRLDYTDG